MTEDELRARMAALEAENARLRWQRDKVAGWNGTDLSELEEYADDALGPLVPSG